MPRKPSSPPAKAAPAVDPAAAFTVLGLAPTLDPMRVKLAYFEALAKHPPHVDPPGFRAIRDAYEALQGTRLRVAYFAAPPDPAAELAALGPQLVQAREQVLAQARAGLTTASRVATFEALLRLELPAAMTRAAGG